MIPRYTRPEMAKIWEDRTRYAQWLRVELAVCSEQARKGEIPRKAWRELKPKLEATLKKRSLDPEEIEAAEKITRHDVIAFTTVLAQHVGPASRYVHFGLTSSDVVDTALSLMIQEAGALILREMTSLSNVLKKQASRWRNLPTIGRSHGIFAEPTSFGLKFLGWHTEWERNVKRMRQALETMRYGKLSGAVGVSPHLSLEVERKILKSLGLKREPVSTQVLPRDRHAELFSTLAICGASLERIAVELRHLQRSEVAEVQEPFAKGQKGSSAMPHKRNPISSENLVGCARLLRAYLQAGLENVALWHERDISHSSVERVALPDAFLLLDYALARMRGVIERLVIRKDQVTLNLSKAGKTVYSGHFLLELVKKGATREDAYQWVQHCALSSLDGKQDFISSLKKHPEVSALLSNSEIDRLGSIRHQLRNVQEIFRLALRGAEKQTD